jgi:leucyl aminopeptidase
VTFDSGGLSIKPAKSMETMKDDMSGAAAVIGLMSIIKELNPKVAVSGYIAATENMVDGFAIRPGDILTAMSGKTIEVLNTDAEGRLTLADAMHYALRGKPDIMIDMATLTGACLVALGLQYSAILGNDQPLIDSLIQSGNDTGEKVWQLPLAEEYRDQVKSPVADLKNTGGSYAGTITAALFLEAFVGKTKWAHLDIAGPAWSDSPLVLGPQGGTGVMVRTLARYLAGF